LILEVAHEGVQRSARLQEVSTSTLLSLPPPLASPLRAPSLLIILVVEPPIEDFDSAWQRWKEEIGEYNEDYFDSQEREVCGTQSNCEELEEEDFDEGEFGTAEVRSLEDLWWPKESLHNMESYKETQRTLLGKHGFYDCGHMTAQSTANVVQ
jgi:hypothetical protein